MATRSTRTAALGSFVLAPLIAAQGCRNEPARDTTPRPSLEVPDDARARRAEASPVETLGLQFEPLDGPPASSPNGPVVHVKFEPPVVGATRRRTQTQIELRRDLDLDSKAVRLQETSTTFVLHENIAAVSADRARRIEVTVDTAEEVLVLDGRRQVTPLLAGTYVVDVGGLLPENMKMTSPGRVMGTREKEELSAIASLDSGSAMPIHDLVRLHPLRMGEAVVLTDSEVTTFLAGDKTPGTITFSLREETDGVAVYQLDTAFETYGERREVRQRFKMRVATGKIVEMLDATHSTDGSATWSNDTKTQRLVRFD
jgi:hypothetical protein